MNVNKITIILKHDNVYKLLNILINIQLKIYHNDFIITRYEEYNTKDILNYVTYKY